MRGRCVHQLGNEGNFGGALLDRALLDLHTLNYIEHWNPWFHMNHRYMYIMEETKGISPKVKSMTW